MSLIGPIFVNQKMVKKDKCASAFILFTDLEIRLWDEESMPGDRDDGMYMRLFCEIAGS